MHKKDQNPFTALRAAKAKVEALRLGPESENAVKTILENMYAEDRKYACITAEQRRDEHPKTPGYLILPAFIRKMNRFLRIERRTQWCAVLFGDVHKFKRINDQFGHVIADQVIAEIARLFRKHIRFGTKDLRCRYGFAADEFVFLVTNLPDEATAEMIVERANASIASHDWQKSCGVDIPVSVDIGIEKFQILPMPSGQKPKPIKAKELVHRADMTMLDIKKKHEMDSHVPSQAQAMDRADSGNTALAASA